MEKINEALDIFLVSDEEYFKALSDNNTKKINLITQAQERKNISDFQKQTYDHLKGKANKRFMDHELTIISNFLNDKTKLIPFSDFEYIFQQFQEANEKELSLVIHNKDHYFYAKIEKNTDNSITLAINDSFDKDLFSKFSKDLEKTLKQLTKEKNINFKVNINSILDKLLQNDGYECGPCSIYNSNKEFFKNNLSLDHRAIKDDKTYEQFFKKLYLANYFLLHTSIIYEAFKEKFKDKIDVETFDLFCRKNGIIEYIAKNSISQYIDSLLKIDQKALTEKTFDEYIEKFDTTVENFVNNQLELFYKHQEDQKTNEMEIDSDAIYIDSDDEEEIDSDMVYINSDGEEENRKNNEMDSVSKTLKNNLINPLSSEKSLND